MILILSLKDQSLYSYIIDISHCYKEEGYYPETKPKPNIDMYESYPILQTVVDRSDNDNRLYLVAFDHRGDTYNTLFLCHGWDMESKSKGSDLSSDSSDEDDNIAIEISEY